ncbi:hypothetical protein FBUS_02604 [Fasciolopsis buskii]|uniref:Uncharacterized protein n=1 Tax=Fasciolopsis buskii TaxID=27845 RepID=A0A8E0RWY9_9TREM|nr:hypothetical protein FBUS_02604 [Fasciolopsis buski]
MFKRFCILPNGWWLLAFLALLWISSTSSVNVFISLETRRSPHQNWTLHRDKQPVRTDYILGGQNFTSHNGLVQHDRSTYERGTFELLDEPQRYNGAYPGRQYTPRPVHNRIPYQPYSVTQQQQIGQNPTSIQPLPNGPIYNSIPPWYADKYRRMPRDESDGSSNTVSRFPWTYQPKCRSCGRPMLQDSFCADDFGK